MKKVSGPKVVTTVEASESPLPAEIQQALGEVAPGGVQLSNAALNALASKRR
jgi:hypothetical protein